MIMTVSSLLGGLYAQHTILPTSCALLCIILIIALRGRYSYPRFTGKKTELSNTNLLLKVAYLEKRHS